MGINAGSSSQPIGLAGGKYNVSVVPTQDQRAQYRGLASLQIKQKNNSWKTVGKSTDFRGPGNVTLQLQAGTYRMTVKTFGVRAFNITPVS